MSPLSRSLNRPLLMFLILALAACSAAAVPGTVAALRPAAISTMDPVFLAGSPIPDSKIDANIDPSLSPGDRQELHDTMALLPPANRRNVTIFRLDGSIIATRRELTARAVTYNLVPGTQNTFRDNNGNTITGPPIESRSGITPMSVSTECQSGTSTGAFRRVCSASGWSGEAVTIRPLPCDAAQVTTRDTPYLLLGGWSPNGIAIDSGLQYSPANNIYTPFFFHENGMQINGQGNIPCWNGYNPGGGPGLGLLNGDGYQDLLLMTSTQFVLDTTFVEENTDGTFSSWSWSDVFNVPSGDGWALSGRGNVWKRATAIAQATPVPPATPCPRPCLDGSIFGWSSGNPTMFNWWNATLGTYGKSQGNVHYTWTPWVTYNGTGGYLSNPDDPNHVFVNYIDSTNEQDGIKL